jgi:hypothetical protein
MTPAWSNCTKTAIARNAISHFALAIPMQASSMNENAVDPA